MMTAATKIGLVLTCSLIAVSPAVPGPLPTRAPTRQVRFTETYGKLPLMFEENKGQAARDVRFNASGHGYDLAVSATAAVLSLREPTPPESPQPRGAAMNAPRKEAHPPSVLHMILVGASLEAQVTGQDQLEGKINYFIGRDPAQWRTNIPTFAKVKCEQAYPGVDLVYYGNQQQLEYDFILAPGANPSIIELKFEGAREIHVDNQGDLVLETAAGAIRQLKPVIYQDIDGIRREIPGHYTLTATNRVGFDVATYDTSKPLVIDPVLSYSTYYQARSANAIAVDPSGNAYVTGQTLGNPNNAFVAKLNAAGSALVYSTSLGGGNEVDEGFDIAVDSAGNAYVIGQTRSANFPTINAYQANRRGADDFFVARLNATGALVYSTYLGGSAGEFTREVGIAVDSAGNVFVAGVTASTTDFPTTDNAFQSTTDYGGYITKLNTNASGPASLVYSSYLDARVTDVALDSSGHVYLLGSGAGFPTTEKAFQRAARIDPSGFASDALIVKLDTNPATCTPEPGTKIKCKESLLYSTYLGGTDAENRGNADVGTGIAVDSLGLIYVTGWTGSTDFPTTENAFQPASRGGIYQAFVVKLDPDPPTCTTDPTKGIDCKEALLYSTYLGGTAANGGRGEDIALDSSGNIYVTGSTASSDFPVKAPFQLYKDNDAFVAKLNPNASGDASLVYSTFLGGTAGEVNLSIAVDSADDAYVSGTTHSVTIPSPDFPTTPGAYLEKGSNGFGVNGFISKISQQAATFFISAISPERGGDTGSVSMTVYGGGFKAGATARLVRNGQPDIPGESTVKSDGQVFALFDLVGKARGLWDVVVTNPNGASVTLPAAFTIEEGKERAAKIEVFGRQNFRPGGTIRLVVTYSNPGNVDILIPLLIRIPEGMAFSLPVPPLHRPLVPVGEPVDFSGLPIYHQRPDDPATPQNEAETIIPLIVNLPPGFTGSIPVNVRHVNANCTSIQISALAGDPIQPGAGADCFASLVELAIELLGEALPGGECIELGFSLMTKAAADDYRGEASSLSSWIASALLGVAQCAAEFFPISKVVLTALKVTDLVIGKGGAVVQAISACSSYLGFQPGYSGPGTATLNTTCVSSSDPNDKIGPTGAGTAHHISRAQALPYLILFENKPVATAPAQTVVITDQLDANKVDLSTLSLGFITFGDKLVIPPPGLSEYTTNVDLRPANNLIVRIEAKLTAGVLTWRFGSIDPATNQPTEDPLAGFLPPNQTPPAGDGSVFFTIMPKNGLAHGTEIRNQASIVFDSNAAIVTPEWLNTIDDSKPASQVTTLAGSQPATSFPVTWSGTDTGSAIQTYTIFVSAAGGPFTKWLTNTTATSGSFPGRPNTAYAFYSVAQDHAGNREDAPAVPDSATVTPIPLTIRHQGTEVIIEWTVPGRLQSSQTLKGGFLDVPAATSPFHQNLNSGPLRFWRLVE